MLLPDPVAVSIGEFQNARFPNSWNVLHFQNALTRSQPYGLLCVANLGEDCLFYTVCICGLVKAPSEEGIG